MNEWKQRLYAAYVSTGQSAGDVNLADSTIRSNPAFRKIIKKLLPADKTMQIVDLACGHGGLLKALADAGYKNTQGIDISQEQVDLAQRLGIARIRCMDIDSFLRDLPGKIHVFFLMDVLEHFERDEVLDLLDRICQKLEDNGLLILHVPNGEGLFGMRAYFGDFTHSTCFTPRSLHQILSACGFHRILCLEDRPVVHGLKSLLRLVLWIVLTAPVRLLLAAETGNTRFVLSQNMLACAQKGPCS